VYRSAGRPHDLQGDPKGSSAEHMAADSSTKTMRRRGLTTIEAVECGTRKDLLSGRSRVRVAVGAKVKQTPSSRTMVSFRLRAALRASLRDGFASLDTASHSRGFSAGEEDGGRAGSDLFE
jgi:hypothetical protein